MWNYKHKTDKQLKNWFREKKRKGINGFLNYNDFKNWYDENVKDQSCHYCGLPEKDSQKIIHTGILTSKRFPNEGHFSKGVNRGYWLEVDKKNPKGIYSRENCVPSCYFCNNDKSDVFTEQQYMEFVRDRIGFLRNILIDNQ
jgi:hypothetical protein